MNHVEPVPRRRAQPSLRLAFAFCGIVFVAANPYLARGQQAATPAPPSAVQSAGEKPKPPAQSAEENQKQPAEGSSTSAQKENAALTEAVESAHRDPQVLIKNLASFLERFPDSPRREQVVLTIYRQALQSNDPHMAIEYGEKLLAIHSGDLALLSSLVDLLGRENDAGSHAKAIADATQFIDLAERVSTEPAPKNIAAEQWQETCSLTRSSGFLMRGKLYDKAGENGKAFADYEKSFAIYPSSDVAERLADLAAKQGDGDRALEYYATAFAFPERSVDPAHREELRKKLGYIYAGKYKSEKGLGDLVLAKYDDLNRALKARIGQSKSANVEVHDPFQFVLERLDGTSVRLGDYRGKVIMVDFWATWCGPCRLAGRLMERVVADFRGQTDPLFLALNTDQDRTGVAGFVREEQWKIPVAYADGLDHLLEVTALPTILIFDRQGRVVFRTEGVDPETFQQQVEQKLHEALVALAPASAPAPSR